ncbi:MAG: D-lyxose/D-mannose family sugar isomerase [Planctomycetes bacterium]|nr:D-lyxose/D-mannose family sugar isomerase [Planctomycetota bacterium]
MKRSQINQIMRSSLAFLKDCRFLLPPFATWSVEDWQNKGPEVQEIIDQQLGWDVTDFGSGDFSRTGLFLFTIRNGAFADLNNPFGKSYCEKIMIVQENQITPEHFHYQKMEDIINRGGGNLVIRMWNATDDEKQADSQVSVSMDGVRVTVPAGGTLRLKPGESVTLPQRNYHTFWGEAGKGTVLVGEVSRVNDDHADNHFLSALRFSDIDEDEAPFHLLYNDYASYYRPAAKGK